MENQPEHSPLGASSAERWMNCPGSIALLQTLKIDDETDEPDYRKNGVAAHAAAASCLLSGEDAWTVVGQVFHGVEIDVEIADAIQVYLDTVRPGMARATLKYVEHRISQPSVHKDFFGTVDLGLIFDDATGEINDYKHGEGIQVDVEWNVQLMYYAYGFACEFPGVRNWKLRIIQPRGWHPNGPIREWEISTDDLCEWAEKELLPAMARTELDHDLDAGPWCRFCPAKLVCPLLSSLFGAAAKSNPNTVVNLSAESLGRSYQYVQAVEFYLKAMRDETYRRLNKGDEVPGTKLVNKKANRVYRAGAADEFKTKFGEKAYTPPELKSPAEMEKVGPAAAALVKEWAYTPNTGLTVALADDKRVGVKVKTTTEAFPNAIATTETTNG